MEHSMPRRVLSLFMTILFMLDLTITIGILQNADTMDLIYGKGEQSVVNQEGHSAASAQYYRKQYATSDAARTAALQVSARISDEGTVLLKNDGLLPLSSNTTVTPLGLGFFRPLYCGSGSSAISTTDDDVDTPIEGLRRAFSRMNTTVETIQRNVFEAQGNLQENPGIVTTRPLDQSNRNLYEFSDAIFLEDADSLRETVSIVYIARHSGENQDLCTSTYEDGTPHALALTAAEKRILMLAKQYSSAVVVVVSSASPMELGELEDDPEIRAILWQGGAGSTGYSSIANILSGRVNPSGRLPFTFAADFTRDPTYANQDDGCDRYTYSNAVTSHVTYYDTISNMPAAFHEYEEGIYLGYRYYETAFNLGTLEDYYDRRNGVVYPFGFGLSYTTFSQEITGVSRKEKHLILDVRVTNTGTVSGKEVVQIYCAAPYTDLDRLYAIEKPAAFLIAFSKTPELVPGQSHELEFSIDLEDLSSYCYTHPNNDGTVGCYMLEQGEYRLSLRRDAHNVLDSVVYNIQDTLWFSDGQLRMSERDAQSPMNADGTLIALPVQSTSYKTATNQFEALNAYMTDAHVSHAVQLTRSNWGDTQPTAPTEEDRIASETVIGWIREADAANDTLPALPSASCPASGVNNGLVLADLRAVPYDDPLWDKLLDQLTYDDREVYRQLLFENAYETGKLPVLRKPRSSENDGPQGLTMADVAGKNWISGVCGYPAAPVMASTWSKEILYDLGAMVGQEALLKGISGWYAPGLNILRSPFCGRASEYYSEDPFLAGILGTQVVSGAGANGLACAIKHFCLMETEAHKGLNTCTFMTEQALREIYLRPFELVVKNARKTIRYREDDETSELSLRTMRAGDFIMVSDSAVGALWVGFSSALLTEVVRGEWGFEGAIITDMHQNANSAMLTRMLSAGCDMLMSSKNDKDINLSDYSLGANQELIRQAVKNVCYMQVNSSLMQGISSNSLIEYKMSTWRLVLLIMNTTVVLMIFILAFVLFRHRRQLP